MRILHTADLHYRLDWYDWVSRQANDYDVLVIAGDLLTMFPLEATPLHRQARVASDWLKTLDKPTIVCTGNHDIWLIEPHLTTDVAAEGNWLQLCKRPGLIVDGQDASIGGERFASVKWGCSDWPDAASIVVCHAPPSETRISAGFVGEDYGDFEIAARIQEKRPKYVLSGHVHNPLEWMTLEGASYCFNPGCDFNAKVPNHIIIDATKKIACWHSASRGIATSRLD